MTPARKLRVLLAEDDPIGARFAIAAVERLGHEVVTAETGREALDQLEREHFDVALLDMGLPELSGLDVARRIRTHQRAAGLSTLVIVALTASDTDDALAAAAEAVTASQRAAFSKVFEASLVALDEARAEVRRTVDGSVDGRRAPR